MALLTGEQRLRHFGLIILPAVTARGYVAWCLAERGDFPEGCGVGEDAVRLAEAAAHPLSMAAALMFVGVLYGRQGHVHQAIPRLARALGLSQTINLPIFFPLTAASLGAAYARAGRATEALPWLDQTMERVATGHRVLFHELVLTELSEALLLVGRVDEARVLASHLFERVRTHTGGGDQVHALRLLGEIAARREPLDISQAVAHYHQALTPAEELGMRPLQAHCHRGLGMLYAATDQREQARAELSAAIVLYRAMDMAFWLPQTEAVLAQVEGR
jgi:tetratricopeptide (TPR) repeat protein